MPNCAIELVQQAIGWMRAGDGAAAVSALERAIALQPDLALAHALLGAELAQQQELARADVAFRRALELDPDQPVSRFQHGLMLLVHGCLADAVAAWAPLQSLPDRHPLALFCAGMLTLAQGDRARATALLEQGVEQNAAWPELNRDMLALLSRLIHGPVRIADE